MRLHPFLCGSLAIGLLALPGRAQDKTKEKIRSDDATPRARILQWSTDDGDADRAVIGVNTSSSGDRDTLGLLVVQITPGGPADKAGLEEGDRIAAVNGVNLKLNRADAGESDMHGLTTRRLVRELRKVEAGKDVELSVWKEGRFQTIRVKTIAAEDLPGNERRRMTRAELEGERDNRAVLGLNLSPTGSSRDTLGVFITRVEDDGPAAKAGLFEGNRVAEINGVDLRVRREDAGDQAVASARASRFQREMRKVKAGDQVTLRVYGDGEYRTVRVTAGRAGDVYKEGNRRGYFFSFGEGPEMLMNPMPPMPPTPPMPPMTPMPPGAWSGETFRLDNMESDAMRRSIEDALEQARRARVEIRRLPRVQIDVPAASRAGYRAASIDLDGLGALVTPAVDVALDAATRALGATDVADVIDAVDVMDAHDAMDALDAMDVLDGIEVGLEGLETHAPSTIGHSTGEVFEMHLPGLRLAKVSPDLAAYLGSGSEKGLRVLEADSRWAGLRPGDVVLSGDLEHGSKVQVLRKGERTTVDLER